MVQRYAHLAAERLVAAVERMVPQAPERESAPSQSELRQDFGDSSVAAANHRAVVW